MDSKSESTVRYLEKHLEWQTYSIDAAKRVLAAVGIALMAFAFQRGDKKIFDTWAKDTEIGIGLAGCFTGLGIYLIWNTFRNFEKSRISADHLISANLLDRNVAEQMKIVGGRAEVSRNLICVIPVVVLVMLFILIVR